MGTNGKVKTPKVLMEMKLQDELKDCKKGLIVWLFFKNGKEVVGEFNGISPEDKNLLSIKQPETENTKLISLTGLEYYLEEL